MELTEAEASCLEVCRRVCAPLDLSACIRQSVQDTTSLGLTREEFVYGEVGEISLHRLLDRCSDARAQARGGVAGGGAFYDLGCGAGKAGVLSALHARSNFSRCVGVELLPGLAACARELAARLQAESQRSGACEFQVVEDDLFHVTLQDAAVVLVNAGCWREPGKSRLARKLVREMPPGSALLTIRQPLAVPVFEGFRSIAELALPMSWGVAPVFLWVRTEDGSCGVAAEPAASPRPSPSASWAEAARPAFDLDAMD